ncbi:MAG TPA: VC0807 family protein [Rhizomicrobium sp.]|jgi:hypothetical protein
MSRVQKIVDAIHQNGARIGLELLVNFALPYLVFSLAQPRWGDVDALMASSVPPILWSVVEFARHRRVDALSVLVLGGIALSLLAFVGTGSARVLQLREKLVTVIIGALFLGSVAIGRPLIYELAKAGMARANDKEEMDRFVALRDNAYFRSSMNIMTLAWGAGLLADALVSMVLVFVLSIRSYLLVGPIIGYATTGGLSLWTFWFARRRKREGEMRRKAAVAEAAAVQAPMSAPPHAG